MEGVIQNMRQLRYYNPNTLLTQDTNNMHNQDTQELNHFSGQAAHWWDKNGPLKTLHDINPARLAFINQHQTINKLSIIDIGCGGGVLSEAMALQGAQVTGLDLAEPLLEQAKLHVLENKLSITYQAIAAEEYAQQHPHAFDVVTCMEMLEHVPDPEAIIAACAKLLKPNGWLFVSTLNKTTKARVLGVWAAEYVLRLLPTGTHDSEKFIAPHTLAHWGRNNNLEVKKLMGLHYNPLTRQATLKMPADINYLMAFQKTAATQ
jgi:2-polyprenyl-6-hydroxyphenyl methylase/3-demethylubiquinone-9 3-methyltransferase